MVSVALKFTPLEVCIIPGVISGLLCVEHLIKDCETVSDWECETGLHPEQQLIVTLAVLHDAIGLVEYCRASSQQCNIIFLCAIVILAVLHDASWMECSRAIRFPISSAIYYVC